MVVVVWVAGVLSESRRILGQPSVLPRMAVALVPARVSPAYLVRLTFRLREGLCVRGPQMVHRWAPL